MVTAKHITISSTGFGLNLETLRLMQDAYSEPLSALAIAAGNKTIVSGVFQQTTDGQNWTLSDGCISYEGVLIPFIGGPVNLISFSLLTVTIIENTISGEYDVDVDNDGQRDTLQKYKTRYAKIGNEGVVTFPFAELKRNKTVKQLSEIVGNVQPDWNVLNPLSDAYIKNKPSNFLTRLRSGYSSIGNLVYAQKRVISFPALDSANYFVIGCMRSMSADFVNDADQTWSIGKKLTGSFELITKEYGVFDQNLRFEYVLIPFYLLFTPATQTPILLQSI